MPAVIKNGNEIKLGADPEFIIIPNNNESPISIDGSWRGDAGDYSRDGGSSSTGELRPTPGSPREVTENIRKIVKEIHNRYSSHRMVVGGGNQFQKYIGGHIHFNIWDGPGTSSPPANMIKALDFFLGRNLKTMNGGNRYGGHYGGDSDCRTKPHGFEYRTSPSFIVDPVLTEAVFTIAYRIAELAIEGSSILDVGADARAAVTDYDILIPVGSPFESYYTTQVENFKDYVFGGFNLSIDDAFDRWLSPIPFEFKRGATPQNIRITRIEIAERVRRSQIEAEARAIREREEAAARMSQSIIGTMNIRTPIRCRIQYSAAVNNSIVQELITHSTIPEIRIHHGFPYSAGLNLTREPSSNRPWRRRHVSVKNDVVYLSDSLKGKFKISRDAEFKVKYVNIANREGTAVTAIVTNRPGINLAELVTKILHSPKRQTRSRARA